MSLKTITFASDKWQLVPKEMDEAMQHGWHNCYSGDMRLRWAAALAAAPQPETVSPWLPIESAPKGGVPFYVSGFNYGNPTAGRWHDVGAINVRGFVYSTISGAVLGFADSWIPIPEQKK